MNKFVEKYLRLSSENTTLSMILVYMSIAYIFGVLIRLILWYQVIPVESFWLDGNPLPIYSPDAGLYGYYAKQLLSGANYPMDAEHMPGYFIYWVVGIFSVNIDWVMFLAPIFLAPLLVIPVVLIGQVYRQVKLGFFAALLGVIGINFYTRSYLGYMDTDTLNLFFPYMAIASFMMALSRRSFIWLIVAIVSLVAFHFWYHSSLIIIAFIVLMSLILTPFIFKSKKIALVSLSLIVVALIFISPQKIIKRATDYYKTDSTFVLKAGEKSYHFANTLDSVAEAQDVNIFLVNDNYVGMFAYVSVASIGYILLCVVEPLFLMLLPMFALGYMASFTGMRFTMFATPVFALGFVGFGYIFANILAKRKKILRYSSAVFPLIAIAMMIINIIHVNPSFMPSSFNSTDVKVLKDFSSQTKEKDLLISWWDYGWPLWYYTGRNNTLIDNGRHGADTYLVSNLLLSKDDNFVANALAYFTDKQKSNTPILSSLIQKEDIQKRFGILKKQNYDKKAERDVYLLLHRNMLLTFKTLEDFAYIDIKTGKKSEENSQLYISDLLRPYSKKVPIVYGDTFDFDLRDGMIKGHDGATAQVQGVIIVDSGKVTAAKRYNPRSFMTLIIYNKTKAIYLDNKALNTFLIKALLFDQYDKKRFEKVTETGSFKILKLK
jgi:asparagine N-glycosylation enzyme membrane subunit Stt3